MDYSILLLEWPNGRLATAPRVLGEVRDERLVGEAVWRFQEQEAEEARLLKRMRGRGMIELEEVDD